MAWRVRRLFACVLAGAATLLGGCGGEPASPDAAQSGGASAAPLPSPPAIGAACADCHGALVDSWNATAMARAVELIGPEELARNAALAPVAERDGGYRYGFGLRDGLGVLVETRAPEHRLELPVAFAIGAGVMDRSYVVLRGRTMWFAPLEVVTGKGGGHHAALAPGNMMQPGARVSTPITAECLGCHTDDPPPAGWPLNLAPERWSPRGIACAACHARDAEHARWREAELAGDEPAGSDPLLALADLGRFERLSVCAACHLQGDARIVLDPDELGPPPVGGDLLEQRAVFVAREPTNEVGFVSHVERLLLSECFLRSEMLCTTCHDPHRALADPTVRTRTRAACGDCHARLAPSHPPEAGRDCVDCHMRRTPVFDVAEVEIHDHWIRTEPGPPSAHKAPGELRFPESPDADWKRVAWPGVKAPAHANDPGLLMMALAHRGHTERATALADAEPGAAARTLPMYHHVRASLLEQAGRNGEAQDAYGAALALDPDLAASATNLGLLEGRSGDVEAGIRRLSAVLEAHPFADGALRNRALLARERGDLGSFVRDLEAAHRVRPDAALAGALSAAYAAAGEPARAREWERIAARLDPLRARAGR
ncbi:MAG: cytochrome c3 family protein [Planctomycetota bacterium]